MKKTILLFAVLNLFQHLSFSQSSSTYWVIFKDKNNSPYSVNKPSEYLSEKALARRNKQKIAVNTSDLPVNANYVYGVKSVGVSILNKSKWFNAVAISTLDVSKINAIKMLPYVKEVQLLSSPSPKKLDAKYYEESTTSTLPKGMYNEQAKVNNVFSYGQSYLQAHQIGADCMHNLGFQGQGMTIAYMDDGFYYADTLPAFDSLFVHNQILGGHNFVQGNSDIYVHSDNSLVHGMMTLSCSAGNLPDSIVGTAPKANFWLFVTENVYSESLQEETNWAVAAEFADSVGVDVINSSLGYSYMTDTTTSHTYAEMNGHTTIISRAAEWAARKGIFVTSSAGNSAGYPWYKITAPADADSILTVGAVDASGVIASFSSRGPTSDGRIKPNTCARGLYAVVQNTNGAIAYEGGTSFSSPITAGAVACLWQAHPTATNQQLIKAIEQSATQYYFPDTIEGYGIPNFCIANAILTDILGVAELSASNDELRVYPNPSNNEFSISFYSNKKQSIKVELYDISGREIYNEERNVNANNNIFRLSNEDALSKGIYILRIISSEKSFYTKLIKE